jgi:hypothetical protein
MGCCKGSYRYSPLTPLYPGGALSARRVSLVINFPPGRAGVGPLSGKKVSQPLSPSRQAETSVNAGPNVLRLRRAGTRRSSRRGMRPILVGHALSLTKVAVSTRRLSAGRGRQGVGGGATNTCRFYPLGCPARTRLSPGAHCTLFPPNPVQYLRAPHRSPDPRYNKHSRIAAFSKRARGFRWNPSAPPPLRIAQSSA